jgi:hypothetical protein
MFLETSVVVDHIHQSQAGRAAEITLIYVLTSAWP